ncbi:amino acid adenylation domain-containing protein [Micromonospora sp. NPDC049051]|uniref:non-ribosomal peptide synthetase n=1 Tax=Micromonospora sp. NPDC049051 TaxID=3364264 RepID=UPI003721BAE3
MPDQSLPEQVAGIIDAVVGCGPVDPSDRFSELGGDSIQAVQVLSLCWSELGVELPMQTLRTETTVSELVAAVAAARSGPAGVAAAPGGAPVPNDEAASVPASPRQAALFSLSQARPELPAYNVPVALWLTGQLDRRRLQRALNLLVHRHDALRTAFSTGPDGTVLLTTRPADSATVIIEELPATRLDLAASLLQEIAAQPLDLTRSPVRVCLLPVAADRHALLVVVHHAVCDGWALNILLSDLCRHYAAEGAEPPTAGPGQRELLSWDEGRRTVPREEALRRWGDLLAGVPTLLDLPLDRSRPPARSMLGTRVPLRVPANLHEGLRARAATWGTTPFALLALALGVLLERYTSRDDLVIGVPTANRHHPRALEAVGYLSNVVPVRLDLRGQPDVAVALSRITSGLATSTELSWVPLDDIAAAVDAERSATHQPLFQVALVQLGNGVAPLRLPGLRVERQDLGTGTSKYDQSWYLEDFGDGLTGYVEYATDLFDEDSVTRMRDHFLRVLEALVRAETDHPLRELTMFSPHEQAGLIDELTPPAGPTPDSVVTSFLSHVRDRPDAPAIWSDGCLTTYRELHDGAMHVAGRLAKLGAGPETVVGLHLTRSPEQVAAVLGVLMAGAAFLPLDPAYPAERLRYMIDDAALSLIVTEQPDDPALHGTPARLVTLDGGGGPRLAPRQVDPRSLAYVIYTSGSTGAPKGVALTHDGLVNVIERSRESFDLKPGTRVLQFVSLSFDASVWETFMALCTGGVLCLGPAVLAESTASLEELIKRSGAEVVFLPPAVLAILDPAAVPSVRLVLTGGDRVSRDLRDRWAARVRFFAAYGPTEGTIVQTWGECPPDQVGPTPVGLPFGGVRLYVLDDELRPVPLGAVGEVYVGGVAVGRGYRGRSDLTATHFLPDCWSPVPGGRMYRTGDLVRRRGDGALIFVGRTDNQVKIRGFRIELGEVEAALSRRADILAAVALVDTQGPRARLAAWLVPAGPTDHDFAERVRTDLRAQLPEHMVPSRISVVASLPHTRNGKVDYSALLTTTPAEDRLSSLLDRLDSLTDAEVDALLAATSAEKPGNR